MEKGMIQDYLGYEGYYLNGIKNGKGIEYYKNGNIYTIGEYLNGKLNGMTKVYSYQGYLEFEGEYRNGEKNGRGKEYDKVGNLISEKEYLNGIPWKNLFQKKFPINKNKKVD